MGKGPHKCTECNTSFGEKGNLKYVRVLLPSPAGMPLPTRGRRRQRLRVRGDCANSDCLSMSLPRSRTSFVCACEPMRSCHLACRPPAAAATSDPSSAYPPSPIGATAASADSPLTPHSPRAQPWRKALVVRPVLARVSLQRHADVSLHPLPRRSRPPTAFIVRALTPSPSNPLSLLARADAM